MEEYASGKISDDKWATRYRRLRATASENPVTKTSGHWHTPDSTVLSDLKQGKRHKLKEVPDGLKCLLAAGKGKRGIDEIPFY